jgi:hypothetical protein
LLGDQLADLDAVLLLQEIALRARIADDTRRLDLLVAVRRRLAGGENLPVDDLIHLTRETVTTDLPDRFQRPARREPRQWSNLLTGRPADT